MSWEDDEYGIEVVEPRRSVIRQMDPMLAMALTSKKWEKAEPRNKIGFSNLPAEVRTLILENFEKPVPRVLRGRRRPGTVYREPKNFLTRRRLVDSIPEGARSMNSRRRKRLAEEAHQEARRLYRLAEEAHVAAVAAEEAQAEAEAEEPMPMPIPRRALSPLRPSAERRKQVARSRARRGKNFNFRPYSRRGARTKF